MAELALEWREPATGLALSLCEDVAATDAWEGPSCGTEHVVRGGGRGLAHDEEVSTMGCSACSRAVEAPVRGVASGGSFTDPRQLEGWILLGNGADDDPYALPWTLRLACSDDGPSCSVEGTLTAEGRLELAVSAADAEPTRHALERAGPATCTAGG